MYEQYHFLSTPAYNDHLKFKTQTFALTMANVYTCPPAADLDLLAAEEDVVELVLPYRYEVVTAATSDPAVAAAVSRVRAALLRGVASRSGLGGCDGPGEREPSRGRWRRLTRGRGSTSIVGLASGPDDGVVLPDACREGATEAAATRADPFEGTAREAAPGLAGLVVVGEDLKEAPPGDEEGAEDAADPPPPDLILASTRIDGELHVHQRAFVPQPRQGVRSNELGEDDGGSNDNLDAPAFNYVSTQSLPAGRSSHTSHNPLSAPAAFEPRSQVGANSLGAPFPSPSKDLGPRPRSVWGCSVVQGRLRLYASTAAGRGYENLEGRVLDALVREARGGALTDDLVTNVRMFDEGGGPVGRGEGVAAAVQSGPPDAREGAGGGFVFSAPLAVLVALGCVLVALGALFVYTSKPRGQQRSKTQERNKEGRDTPSECGTYHDGEVEMDIYRLPSDDSCTDDAPELVRTSRSTGGIVTASSAAPGSAPVANPLSPARSSSFFGLIPARPRPISPEDEALADEDVSLYDCDDGVASVDVGRGQAQLLAEGHEVPLDTVEERQLAVSGVRTKSSWFGRVFGRGRLDGVNPEELPDCTQVVENKEGNNDDAYRGPVDVDALLDELASSVTAGADPDAGCVATPGALGGPGRATAAHPSTESSKLRFFSARDGRAGPHTDIETSLRPFDECSEYSTCVAPHETRCVESQYFVGTPGNDGDNDCLPLTSWEGSRAQAHPGQTRVVRKFGNMLHRLSSRDEGDGCRRQRTRAYSEDKGRNGKVKGREGRKSPDETPVYAMQRQPSAQLQRPIEFYQSPSTLSAQMHGRQRKDRGADPSRNSMLDKSEDLSVTSSTADHESVVAYDGPMCAGMEECWLPDCWRQET